MLPRILKYAGLAVLVLLILGQFAQPDRINAPENPAATFDAVAKPSPQVAAIVKRACQDCHSNNTVWPWYSRITPVSWVVADHVKEGRSHLNLSEWGMYGAEMSRLRLKEACAEVKKGDMPIWSYRLMHPEARLSTEDVDNLCSASKAP